MRRQHLQLLRPFALVCSSVVSSSPSKASSSAALISNHLGYEPLWNSDSAALQQKWNYEQSALESSVSRRNEVMKSEIIPRVSCSDRSTNFFNPEERSFIPAGASIFEDSPAAPLVSFSWRKTSQNVPQPSRMFPHISDSAPSERWGLPPDSSAVSENVLVFLSKHPPNLSPVFKSILEHEEGWMLGCSWSLLSAHTSWSSAWIRTDLLVQNGASFAPLGFGFRL